MVNQYAAAAKLCTSAIAIAISIVGSISPLEARSSVRTSWPAYTVVSDISKEAPAGWAEFCRNYKSECDVQSSTPSKIVLTTDVWNKLVDVNRWANAHIKATDDWKHWHRYNKWYFADDGMGDCKDYVLVKRRMLMESALPREDLLIAIVWTPERQGHAVLVVRTDKGDYVLDNLSSNIMLWKQTPYTYVTRQSQSNPNIWLYIDGDPLNPPATGNPGIAENPLNEPLVLISELDRGPGKQVLIAADEHVRVTAERQVIGLETMVDGKPKTKTPSLGSQ
jgi:predicted transglutaminase-like cysteine proteinase